MKLKILLTSLILLIGIMTIMPSSVFSEDEVVELNNKIKQHKDKIKELEQTMEKYKKNIEDKKLEAVSLKNQMSILDNRIKQIETDVELTEEKITSSKLEIQALEITIGDKNTIIERQKIMIDSMVKKIQADDQKNYIEILLTNKSFADFYSETKSLENVYSDLGRSVKNLRIAKQELTSKKEQIDERKKTYENLKNQLTDKKQDFGEQVNIKKNLLADTKASEAQYQTLLSSLKSQYQTTEGEVRKYEEQLRKKLSGENKLKNNLDEGGFGWPVPSRYITAKFHDSTYPFRNVFEHNAIDIRASYGTPVKAAASGYVGRARRCTLSSCYAYVLLVHTGNLSTVYGHLSKISVDDDQFVNKGDIIGYSGGTPGTVGAGPFVTGAHLHFEVRLNGIPVDPLGYLVQ